MAAPLTNEHGGLLFWFVWFVLFLFFFWLVCLWCKAGKYRACCVIFCLYYAVDLQRSCYSGWFIMCFFVVLFVSVGWPLFSLDKVRYRSIIRAYPAFALWAGHVSNKFTLEACLAQECPPPPLPRLHNFKTLSDLPLAWLECSGRTLRFGTSPPD